MSTSRSNLFRSRWSARAAVPFGTSAWLATALLLLALSPSNASTLRSALAPAWGVVATTPAGLAPPASQAQYQAVWVWLQQLEGASAVSPPAAAFGHSTVDNERLASALVYIERGRGTGVELQSKQKQASFCSWSDADTDTSSNSSATPALTPAVAPRYDSSRYLPLYSLTAHEAAHRAGARSNRSIE